MIIKNTGEVYLGEFENGKQVGYGYCCRSYEYYEVEAQRNNSLKTTIPAYITSATYQGELCFLAEPIAIKK